MVTGHIPGPESWSNGGPEVAAITADLLVTEFALSDNWLNKHNIVPETEDKLLMQALQGAHDTGSCWTRRGGEVRASPGACRIGQKTRGLLKIPWPRSCSCCKRK